MSAERNCSKFVTRALKLTSFGRFGLHVRVASSKLTTYKDVFFEIIDELFNLSVEPSRAQIAVNHAGSNKSLAAIVVVQLQNQRGVFHQRLATRREQVDVALSQVSRNHSLFNLQVRLSVKEPPLCQRIAIAQPRTQPAPTSPPLFD